MRSSENMVRYQTDSFLDKNRDYVVMEHYNLLSSSKCFFCCWAFLLHRQRNLQGHHTSFLLCPLGLRTKEKYSVYGWSYGRPYGWSLKKNIHFRDMSSRVPGSGRPYGGNMRKLKELMLKSGNRTCADCGAPDPKWASANIGVFLCLKCCSVHRSLGTHISKVPLDYPQRAYLEVIFLNPRMKIYVQGSLVKSRPLAKSLNKTKIINGDIGGKPIQLILGRCQKEWELMNGGIFLYWRGRLIEAYKRVGGMMHTPIMGRGVIGVADVTDAMHDGNRDLINTTKQAFQESPSYTELEKWLGDRTDEYWDEHFEPPTHKKERKKAQYKADNVWVQCEECRKWRILTSNVKTKSSSQEWFCDMPPLSGNCETPEDEFGPGVCFSSHQSPVVGLENLDSDRDC